MVAAGAAAVVAAGAFTGFQFAQRPEIAAASPGPGGAVATANPAITVTLSNSDALHGLRVTLDDRATRPVSAGGGRIVVPTRGLSQGRHTVQVSFRSQNLFARRVTKRWTFVVDTTAPRLALQGPAPYFVSGGHVVRFHGTGEPRALITVSWPGGKARGRAGLTGAWHVRARLPEGQVTARVVATDRAGNATARSREVIVDTVGPLLQITPPGGGEPLTATDEPIIYGTVGRDLASRLTFGAKVNGRTVGPIAVVDASQQSIEPPATDAKGTVTVDGRSFKITVGMLPQGRSRVEIWARDRAGNTSRRYFDTLVDSTDRLGQKTLVRGARGADVTALQTRLKEAGLIRKRTPSGVFDNATMHAVSLYQRRHHLGADGVVGPRTLRTLVGRIVITLSQYKLRLIRDGKVVVTFPVAVGQTAYPTPTGKWRVVMMQTNPTWLPPDSPWAKGLGPIPPGPGNPLGTR
ncbi:MAG: hypothetical protein QOK40_3217, partial [Miltoncostaeaceae bacterium]|nr:hypothetical protein [Miltoncostaeaceae bacterium]